jgi:predicted TPR repeat methyltransferase
MSEPTPHPAAFESAKAAFLEGLAHLQAGRTAEAEAAFEASLAQVPGRVSTLVNLAATRLARGRPQEALATADQVLAVEPGNPDAALHRAVALRQLGRHAEALAAFDAALAQRADWADGWVQRGQSLLALDRPQDALQAFDRALGLDATHAVAWSCRADLLRDMGRLNEARTAYEQALAHGADETLTRYCLAGLGQAADTPPRSAPRAYVETLFDDYAADFEQHVVQMLHYRVPEGLAAPLATMHPQAFGSALDLGCGTGLCGPLVKPLTRRLVGVDLAQKMLDQAQARGVYDALLHADIVQYLDGTPEQHDLVLAADVFIYMGDLQPVFAALHRVIPAGGIFCYSAETLDADEATDFALLPSLRYAHHPTYLQRLAEWHGFETLRMARETVREEQRQPIEGLLVHLRRR